MTGKKEFNYYQSELDKINEMLPSEFAPMMKIYHGTTNTATRWLDVNEESAPVLIKWLQSFLPQAKPELGRFLYDKISHAVKSTGTYSWEENACFIEESLTAHELDKVKEFMDWVHKDEENRAFGWGNYEQRYSQFIAAKKGGNQ